MTSRARSDCQRSGGGSATPGGGKLAEHAESRCCTSSSRPDGTPVAVQCKRKKTSIGPGVIRELLGATTSGMHKGRRGILMTNAEVTPGARAYAEENGITVIDRAALQQWMGQARKQIEQRRQPRMRPAGLVTAGVVCAAVIVVSTVAFQVAAAACPPKVLFPDQPWYRCARRRLPGRATWSKTSARPAPRWR